MMLDEIKQLNVEARESFERWASQLKVEAARMLAPAPPPPSDRLDAVIASILERFRVADESNRATLASQLNRFALKRLIRYSAEAAEEALTQRSPHLVELGLMAVALEGGREELRDSIMSLAMLYYTAQQLDIDAQQLFTSVSTLVVPGPFQRDLSKEMSGFPLRPAETRSLEAFDLRIESTEAGLNYRHCPPWLKNQG